MFILNYHKFGLESRIDNQRTELVQSLNTHQFVSKLIPNSKILRLNHELNNIVVNKGRIYGEIREF